MTAVAFQSALIDLGGPVHVADFGGSGKPLVCVHGLGGSHLNWMAAAPLLSERHRVLAVDLIGFGRTPLAGRSASVESNQQLVDRFLREYLGERAVLVGNSMGGLISLMQADASPDSVEAVALVNAAMPHPSTWAIDPHVLALFATMAAPGLGELFMWFGNRVRSAERKVGEMFAMCCADVSSIGADVISAHIAMVEEHTNHPWVSRAYLQATRSLVRLLLNRERFHGIVKRVRTPALVVAGAHDRLVRLVAAEAVARMRPDWRFKPLAHVGHVPHMEDPRGFAELMFEWFDELSRAEPWPSPAEALHGAADVRLMSQ